MAKTKKTRRGPGRPKAGDDLRENRVGVRLNDEELALCTEAAALMGVSPATWFRVVGLKAARAQLPDQD